MTANGYCKIVFANVMLPIHLDLSFAASYANRDTQLTIMYIEILINKLIIYIIYKNLEQNLFYHLKFLYYSKTITIEKKMKQNFIRIKYFFNNKTLKDSTFRKV